MKVKGFVLLAIAVWAMGEARAQSACGQGSGPYITVSNLRQNEVVGYELLLIKGSVSASVEKVNVDLGGTIATAAGPPTQYAATNEYAKVVREWPAGAGRFKAMAHLRRGPNRIVLSAPGHRNTCLDINFSPSPAQNKIRMVFVLAKDGSEGAGVIPAAPGDLADMAAAKRKLAFGALLMETAMAEMMYDAGYPRQTVNFKRDARGNVDVTVFHSAHLDLTLRAKTADELWDLFHGELDTAFQDGRTIFLSMLGDFGAGALGGRNQAMFGTSTLYSWAQGLDELTHRFTDDRKPRDFQLEDESGFRNAFWANYSTGIGATLHELGHALGLPHSGDANDIMERGFDRFNRIFMMREDGGLITDPAVHYSPTSASLLYQSPWVNGSGPAGIVVKPRSEGSPSQRSRKSITLDLAAGDVTLDLHAPDGAKAASLFKGRLPGGRHEFALPELSPGLYFCALKQGGSRKSVSRILIP